MSNATTNNSTKPSGESSSSTNTHKKESILELSKYMDAKVRVRCLGGRELVGILRGYDELVNLVLDHTIEYLRGKNQSMNVLFIYRFGILINSRSLVNSVLYF